MPFDHRLPSDVSLRARSPLPERDPTLGVPLAQPAPPAGEPAHRLVVIGDSLSQGFQNLAVSNTSLSWPKILKRLRLGPSRWVVAVRSGGAAG